MAGCRVLVCEDCVAGFLVGERRVSCVFVDGVVALGVDCGHDVEEVLEFVVVLLGRGHCHIQRVEERWIVRTKGEFGYHVGKIELFVLYNS